MEDEEVEYSHLVEKDVEVIRGGSSKSTFPVIDQTRC